MPRFFFEIQAPGQTIRDGTGMELADVAAARAEAVNLLPLSNVELPVGSNEFRSWTVTIRDDAQRLVARLIMAVLIEVPEHGGERTFRSG